MLKDLEALCALRGVSGDESAVAAYITKQLNGICTWHMDALGSVIAQKKGARKPKNSILLCTHMDEPGFLITGHTDEGLLHFTAVGDVDSRVIIGKPVLAGDGAFPGIVGAKPVHMMTAEERDAPLKVDDLFIDLGFTAREAAEAAVCAGERAVFDSAFTRFGEGLVAARALTGRAGCAALLALARTDCAYDMTLVFATQHEAGGGAMRAAAYATAPDIAIFVEAVAADDIPGVPPERQICGLGKGPVLSFADKETLYDNALYRLALATAQACGVPVQSRRGAVGQGGAHHVQTVRGGVRCASVALPCRYVNSPCCVMNETDCDAAARLLPAFAAAAAAL